MGFSFFSKKSETVSFEGIVDFHTHVLPGIDDGSKNTESSLKMMDAYKKLGITKAIASPHIYQEVYPNTKESIQSAYDALCRTAEYASHPVNIVGFAAEYMVDDIFLTKLVNGDSLLCSFDQHVLIEVPFFGQFERLKEALFIMQEKGYQPILAHPERYVALNNSAMFKELKIRGAMMQLNAMSLMGHYGPEVRTKALKWLCMGLYDFVCTDAHYTAHLNLLSTLQLKSEEIKAWQKLCDFHKEYVAV